MCPTIEEHAKILGVHHDTDSSVSPPINLIFKLCRSKTLRIKRASSARKVGQSECKRYTLSSLYDLIAGHVLDERNQTTFLASHKKWNYDRLAWILPFWIM